MQPRPLRIHLTDLSLQEQLLFPLVMILSILSFPARAIIISSGYDQYYRYYLLLLFDYHFFLIIISYNQFFISLQQQLSSPRDYYQLSVYQCYLSLEK